MIELYGLDPSLSATQRVPYIHKTRRELEEWWTELPDSIKLEPEDDQPAHPTQSPSPPPYIFAVK